MKKKREYILKMIVGVVICILGMVMFETKSMAYWTANTSAEGTIVIPNYILKTEVIKENNNIIIQNIGTAPCFVRVKICVPSIRTYRIKSETGKWTKGEDGYLYYNEALVNNAKRTEKLVIEIDDYIGEGFNYVVVGESSLAMYNEEGRAYTNWNRKGNIIK